MTVRRVLVTDISWPDTDIERRVLDAVGAELVLAPSGEEAELVELVRDADAILTCFAQVTPAVVAAGERLQVIGRYGIGVDNIAVEAATARDIPVTNVPAYCLDEVAEHVLAMILSLERGLHRYDRAVRDGQWSLTVGTPTRRIRGRTLGIVGFGRIGEALAQRAQAFGMNVVAYEPSGPQRVLAAGAQPLDLMEVAAASDYVSLHAPLSDRTRGMIGRDFFRAMPADSYLVNAARGGLVDQDALVEALATDEIAGAGLDVFVPERLAPDHPLMTSDRVLATPHTAFYSEESMVELARLAAENVAAILAGRRPAATVNPAVLDAPRWAHLQP
jgi:D-3-phosphoglycerate dehydrogenase